MTDTKLYADRDISAFPKLYGDHVSAMTREGLHNKSDIAAELAYRDSRIIRLEEKLANVENSSLAKVLVQRRDLEHLLQDYERTERGRLAAMRVRALLAHGEEQNP